MRVHITVDSDGATTTSTGADPATSSRGDRGALDGGAPAAGLVASVTAAGGMLSDGPRVPGARGAADEVDAGPAPA